MCAFWCFHQSPQRDALLMSVIALNGHRCRNWVWLAHSIKHITLKTILAFHTCFLTYVTLRVFWHWLQNFEKCLRTIFPEIWHILKNSELHCDIGCYILKMPVPDCTIPQFLVHLNSLHNVGNVTHGYASPFQWSGSPQNAVSIAWLATCRLSHPKVGVRTQPRRLANWWLVVIAHTHRLGEGH